MSSSIETALEHGSRSHYGPELRRQLRSWLEAKACAELLWVLETDGAGEDDVLIGPTRGGVLEDVLDHHELDALPEGWTLEQVHGWDIDGLDEFEAGL